MSTPSTKSTARRTGGLGLWRRTPMAEAETIIRAEHVEDPTLVIVGNGESALVLVISVHGARLTLGRSPENRLPLTWDRAVSSVHAAIVRELDLLSVEDLGPSRNGTFVNGIQITGRTRLEDRDVLRCGVTEITVRCPTGHGAGGTELLPVQPDWSVLTGRQRAIVLCLIELWPPERRHFDPPGNSALASALGMSIKTLRPHLKEIYRELSAFGVENTASALAAAASGDEAALRALEH